MPAEAGIARASDQENGLLTLDDSLGCDSFTQKRLMLLERLDEKLLRSLREKPVQDLKTVLYANEFYPEFCARGFLALE